MAKSHPTCEVETGSIATGADVVAISMRGWTDEERKSFWQDVENYENRRRARKLYRKYKDKYGTDGRAFEEASEHLPFGWRQVKRIVKGY